MTSRPLRIAAPSHEENPDWLTAQPTKETVSPPVQTRVDRLPFLELSWENFERLCRRLADADSEVERAWTYGKRGQKQYGIDLLVRRKDGCYEVWQTKRYKNATAADVKKALNIFLKHSWTKEAKQFTLVFACPLEKTKVVEAVEEARTILSSRNIAFNPIDTVLLTELLIPHPEIIDDFFGRPWVIVVCPQEAIRRLSLRSAPSNTETLTQYQTGRPDGDPHISASSSNQEHILELLAQSQADLATKEDLAAVAKSLRGRVSEPTILLPRNIADRELETEFSKALGRRGFSRTNTSKELASLANRAIKGDLALASQTLRAEVCDKAARANAIPETMVAAERFRNEAAKLDPTRDLFVVDAYLKEGSGDPGAALRDLKTRHDIDARSAVFFVLVRQRGSATALEWARSENLEAADLTPPSALNLVISAINKGEFDAALDFMEGIPDSYLDEIPALYLLRAQLLLASLLPHDKRSVLFHGMPIDPCALQFASGPSSDKLVSAALADLQMLLGRVQELGVDHLVEFLSEFALWLRIEIPTKRDDAHAQLVAELADPGTILQRVRLALAYDVPFESDALLRSLNSRKELGGWTADELFAAFLLAVHGGDPYSINTFFVAHREDLFAQSDLALGFLAAVEIEALARSGRIDDARQMLVQHRACHLTDEQANDAEELIVAIENNDEVEWHRQRYEQSKSLQELQMLVGGLRTRHDTKLLAEYAPKLVRETRNLQDFDVAIKSLYEDQRDAELIELCDELPDQMGLDPEYEAIKGWALYRVGRVVEAREIAHKMLSARGDANDRELAINTSVETGDWGYLQSIVSYEVNRLDTLSPEECMRLARLCLEVNSPYVDVFRNAAIAKAPENPHVYLSAYILATESGEEGYQPKAHEWFQRAIELSGPDGPVQSVSFRKIIEHTSNWREHTNKLDKALREAEIPAFMVARAVNRRLLDLTLSQAQRNLDAQDQRISFPVFAYSGASSATEITSEATVAIDITALITLQHLGILDRALGCFKKVIISPHTLGFLFAERQYIRIQQPSLIARARRIQSLIASGRLKTIPKSRGHSTSTGKEMGEDLATLLETAAAQGGLVVRIAPVPKIGSYLEEHVDMGEYEPNLTDTHRVLSFLSARIESERLNAAETYLRQVDKGWPEAQPVESASILYLDDLTVTYLDHVGILESLTSAVAGVYVHSDVSEETQENLKHVEDTDNSLAAIDEIRQQVAAGIESGRVAFSLRDVLVSDQMDDQREGQTEMAPTLDLLSNLVDIDFVVADDRNLNKLPSWSDKSDRMVPCATTLDVLSSLRTTGQLDNNGYLLARHRLRASGFYAVPLDAEELLHWLGAATFEDATLRETPELKAIREGIVIPQIHSAYLPGENRWLNGIRLAIYNAVRQTWRAAADPARAAASADWLMSVLPDPLAWCTDLNNQTLWATARQQAGMQAAMFMVFAEANKRRQRRYFQWAEQRIADPMQKNRPEIWDAGIKFLKSYLEKLTQIDDQVEFEAPDEVLAALLINPLPASVRMPLLLDDEFRTKLGIEPFFGYPLSKKLSVETGSLHTALRAAIAGRASVMIKLSNGSRARAKLGRQSGGKTTLFIKGEGFAFTNADILSAERRTRMSGLRRVFAVQPVSETEEIHWLGIGKQRALTDREYDDLMTTLGHTPEAFATNLQKLRSLSPQSMVPDAPEYFERLVAPLGEAKDMESFIRGELTANRHSLLERNSKVAIRRIAFSALWQPLIPFDQLFIDATDLSPLLDAEDPFTLLFGFEVCRALLDKGATFVDLGSAFLRKLLGDQEGCVRRCEMFAACAIVTTIEIRRATKAASAPVFWTRLAALAHAGVLTDALAETSDAGNFLDWVFRNFYPQYWWNSVVDRRETPRWCPDWISPDYIYAELVGRVLGVLSTLKEAERPADWVKLIDTATERLEADDKVLAAIFPGPLDDFIAATGAAALQEESEVVEASLEHATCLSDVKGLAGLTYASIPSERAIHNVARILTLGMQDPSNDTDNELKYLKLAAHFALATRSETVAQAVIDRCFVIARMHEASSAITDILAVIMEACAVYHSTQRYYEVVSEYSARICFLVDGGEYLSKLDVIFDVLVQRDEKLAPALGRARAIARTKLGRAKK